MQKNSLRTEVYLPLAIDECVYLRGCIRSYVHRLRQGDERDYLNRILSILEQMMSNSSYFQTVNF